MKLIPALILLALTLGPSAATAQSTLVDGPGMSSKQQSTVADALTLSEQFLKEKFGVSLRQPVSAFASNDAEWLTDNYLEVKNLGENYRAGKMREFGSCEPSAEAGYFVMFLCLNDPVWKSRTDAIGVVMHEYTHNLQFDLLGSRGKNCCTDNNAMSVFGPQWMVEGSAEYMNFGIKAQLGSSSLESTIRRLTRSISGGDLSLRARETRKGFREQGNSWDVGVVAVHLLASTSGLPALVDYWRLLGSGIAYDAAFKKAFGRTLDEFDMEFAKAVQ